jgi:hypothetical protein
MLTKAMENVECCIFLENVDLFMKNVESSILKCLSNF